GASFDTQVVKVPGHALYSNGQGRVDLGYYDYFFNDFTIDFWLKPNSDGTILANRTRDGDPKGWELWVESGALKFEYSPRNTVNLPRYEQGFTQTTSIRGGSLSYGNWNHVALVHERRGNVALYINGQRVASGRRIIPEATLNSSMILSLFGDGIERRTIEASVDELKIWTKALTEEDIRHEMYSTNADGKDGLVAYWPFNSGTLETDLETFTRKAPKSRVLAKTAHSLMNVPICARYVSYDTATAGDFTFSSGEKEILSFTAPVSEAARVSAAAEGTARAAMGKFGVYAFDASQWQNEEDNLNTDYFDYHPMGYLIHPFDGIAETDLEFDFHPVEGEFNPHGHYRLYVADVNRDKQVWEKIGTAVYNADRQSVRVSGISLSDIADKKLLLVTTRPSIELTIEGIGPDGVLPIYDETESTFPLSANILDNLIEPAGVYEIESDGILKPSGLYFAEGKAVGELRLDLTKLGEFNTSVHTTLRGTNNVKTDVADSIPPSLIPLALEVRNRIAPRKFGDGVKLDNGFVSVGSQATFRNLMGSRNMTMMGWVRIDSLKVINSGDFNLMIIRDNNDHTNGIKLINGKPRLAHNGEFAGPEPDANFRFTADDLGRWMHLALVISQERGLVFYLNGQEYPYLYGNGGKYNPPAISRGINTLFLGKNSSFNSTCDNSDNFCGAFDQVSVWSKALTSEEILKYMYSTPLLNDDTLLAYADMDYTDSNDTRRDIKSDGEIKSIPTTQLRGSVTFGETTPLPCDPRAGVFSTDEQSPISLSFPAGKNRTTYVTTFRGTPYCYLNHEFQNYTALNQDFYGLTFLSRITGANRPAEGETVTLTYRHKMIAGDEHLAVAMRRTGTLDHLAGFIQASSVEPGVATFEVPATYLSDPSEVMFFTYPDEGGEVPQRPATLQLSFPLNVTSKLTGTEEEVPTLVITGEETSIPVVADVMALSRNYDVPVRVRVNETGYASPSQETIDFSATENRFSINIDTERMDKFGINPITLNLEGATANELKLNVRFEPYVELTLLNGDHRDVVSPGASKAKRRSKARKAADAAGKENNTFRTTSPVANLEVEAELVQGYLPEGEQIKLEVISELSNSLTIGNGNLLKNEAVTYDPLSHHASAEGSIHEGWNMVGNPYMTNINLTKSQNVDYDPESVTKYLYQCDPATGNYKVYDMTEYDASNQIHPFQSYFVQVMEDEAEFTITPVAKEVEPTKRTRSYKVVEKQSLVLGLDDAGKEIDRVAINSDPDGDRNFVTNQDAPKMWNITGSTPELYAMTGDGKETAVITTPADTLDLGVKAPSDPRTLRLKLLSQEGLASKIITVHDNVTGADWVVSDEHPEYEFTASGTDNHRFTLEMKDDITTSVKDLSSDYGVHVDGNTCTVTGLHGDAIVSVVTPNGLSIMSQHTQTPTLSVYLEDGVYIVTIQENRKKYSSKILVQ
ncbi:MAG: LamG domain-containing protein, partial [Muribaculaceae bacterium]|nr:LamG domain-containing protein [Muribaculaceae bacterium]